MKKIMTAVAAVAMATSMFAADVAATAKLGGSLFNLAGGKVSALNVADDAVASHKPAIAMSVNGDKAGASVKYINNYVDKDGKTTAFKLSDHSIWFAPVDALKITLGNNAVNINQEKIDWCNTDTAVDGFGYTVDVNAGAVSVTAMLLPGEAKNDNGNGVYDVYWLTDGKVATTAAFVKYNADFGSIGVMADFEDNFKKMAFGAGYAGAAGSVSYFANGVVYLKDGLSSIRGEAYCSAAVDSIGISVFVPMTYVMSGANAWETTGKNWHKGGIGYSGNKDGQVILGTTAKVTFPVAGVGGSLYVACNDWLADGLSVNVKPGVSGSCGIMGWEAYLDMNIAKSFTLNVPFVTTVAF